jgi:hypothetical protein
MRSDRLDHVTGGEPELSASDLKSFLTKSAGRAAA